MPSAVGFQTQCHARAPSVLQRLEFLRVLWQRLEVVMKQELPIDCHLGVARHREQAERANPHVLAA
jgi:hypothetical protein